MNKNVTFVSYTSNAFDGQSAREEVSDGRGTVKGFYKILTAEGLHRIVNYIADHNGFRASVSYFFLILKFNFK